MNFLQRFGLSLILAAFGSAHAAESLTFEKDVRPILKTHCFHCHGEDGEKKGGLDVRLARFLAKGGKSGPALIASKSDESHLLEVLKSGEMPKEKPRLSDAEIGKVEQWIAQGAKTARPEPETLGPEHHFTEEERSWWSLQPIDKVTPPEVADGRGQNGIDSFVARKLAENELTFSEAADSRTLIRRVTFDLTGMPPTPKDVDTFLAASQTDPEKAYGDLIDRLLASPAYGERWARHWLDVAGYADSDGVAEKDLERKHAWKYRDYVIASLNRDKPFDEFVREQLAGDEIAHQLGLHADSPTDEEKTRYAELLTATGFLRMAPDGTGAANNLLNQNQSITDTMKIVSTAFYGMTIQCAECHDHRYDPITQADFFELRAVFDPGFDPKSWRRPSQRLVSLQTSEDKAKAAEIETEAKKVDAERLKMQTAFIDEVLEKELAKRDEAIRDPLRAAFKAVVKERTPEQLALLKQHPSIEKLNAGSLYLYDTTYKTKHAATLKEMSAKAAEIRAKKPTVEYVHAFAEVPKKPEAIPASFLFHRGDPESPKEEVKPSDLSVLSSWRDTSLPENVEALPTSGRRLALAKTLTDGEHPLLARVMVNRVWMHHFGTGLVKTVADFGHLGETPSHPELLDWLATKFMESGWSLKQLHRTILLSHTWRQSSQRDATKDRIDPDNRLLSRQNKRRLEAEILRDSLLSVSGKLNGQLGGEPVPVMLTEEGQVVIGVDTTDTAGRQTGKFISLEGAEFRKSIYVQIRRSRPLEMFAAFDAPPMTDANCEIRPVTTVSPQSLLLMNNIGMREFAQYFAERLEKECADADAEAVIEHAWKLCYGRPPTESELKAASDFLTLQTAYYTVNPAKLEVVSGPAKTEEPSARFLGLSALAHGLMSANEFLYLD
ncbi:MAG: PSD1 and planctomycete cytochrome C domain-containing protein [Verrucomicrobiales bacterium]|nr:PSD1 and planctomycete cytochrome C domain-containing protein [Verrucomicrobiales bacterium]